jgi:long-chain acyl-CoA synthetase
VVRDAFVPHQFAADARAYGVRMFPGVPFMFEHFAGHLTAGAWPEGVDRLISAGARLARSTSECFERVFGVKIHSFYGTSETGGIAYDDSPTPADEGTVGRPMPGVTVTLWPEEGAPAAGGRVHVAGGAVSSGYAGEEGGGEGFTGEGFLTGDFGRFDAGGSLILAGRVSAFINVAGRKVQPDEVEAVLRQMPRVADVRVVGAADPARGQQIVACIVPRGPGPGLLEVRQFCAGRLAAHKIPRAIVALEAIPLTERGKTDRRRLQSIVEARVRGVPEAGVL